MNFSDDTTFLIELAVKAGDMARKAFDPLGNAYEIKGDNSPVTKTDIAINQMIIDQVQIHRPQWGVLGEELQWNTDAETLLVVDPIDGTKPFIWGQATFGCMLPLVVAGEVVAAVVKNPILQRTVVAEKGRGAWLLEKGVRVYVNDIKDLDRQTIYLHSGSVLCSYEIIAQGGGFVAGSSAAEITWMTARGAWGGAIMNLPSPHDIASAKIIVEEAGGKVTDLQGNEQSYAELINGAIISNGAIHQQLVDIYKQSTNHDNQ